MAKEKPVDEKAVVDYYLQPHGLKDTCKKFHIGEPRFKKILAKYGETIRHTGRQQTYHWNKEFFIIPSKNLAYFLGLMGSDGCVSKNSNQIYIELQIKDKPLLEKVRKVIKLDRPVKEYCTKRGYNNCKLYIEDKELKKYFN